MKSIKLNIVLLSLLMSSTLVADGASENASTGSKHSILAVAHGSAFSAQVASGVVAVPLLIVGSLDDVSTAAGEELMKIATDSETLTITEVTITAAPSPQEVMQAKEKE